jgi:hypothetical protein
VTRSFASLQAAAAAALVSLLAISACGDDAADGDASGSGAAGGSGGKSGSAASSSGGDVSAGASSEGGSGAASSAGSTGSGQAGMGSGAGGDPTGDGGQTNAGGALQVPGPAPGGGSVYAVECSGETEMCMTEYAHCLGLNLPDDQVGFACSNHCETAADCSDEPTGAEAQPGCIPFTMEKRCMLACLSQGTDYACPDGMSCYVYPNATIGYCLWM